MPCKGDYRKEIEDSKDYHAQERKREESAEYRHWAWLLAEVHRSVSGFAGLSRPNQLFYAARLLVGDVESGGFVYYFKEQSADYYAWAVEGLKTMGAAESLALLCKAREILFLDHPIPPTQDTRLDFIESLHPAIAQERFRALASLDALFRADSDGFADCADRFARQWELYLSV